MDADTEAYITKLQVTFNSLAHRITADAEEIATLIRERDAETERLQDRIDFLEEQLDRARLQLNSYESTERYQKLLRGQA